MAYPEGLLTSGERVLEHLRPHTRMLVLPAVVPPVAAGTAMWLAALASRATWHVPAWIALAVVAVGVVVRFSLVPLLRWWCTRLVVTDRRVLVREGVVSRSAIAVAGSSIAGVRTRQSGSDRMFGCGTLLLGTRDADEPWELHGIPHVVRTATLIEEVAEARGGLRGPDHDAYDDDAYDDDGYDDPHDEDGYDDVEILEGELEDDDPADRRRRRERPDVYDDADLEDDDVEEDELSRARRSSRWRAGRTSR